MSDDRGAGLRAVPDRCRGARPARALWAQVLPGAPQLQHLRQQEGGRCIIRPSFLVVAAAVDAR